MRARRGLTAMAAVGMMLVASIGLAGAEGTDSDGLLAGLGLTEEQIEEVGDQIDELIEQLIEDGIISPEQAQELREAIAAGTEEDLVERRFEDAKEDWDRVREERLEAWEFVRTDFESCLDEGGVREDCRRDARDAMDEVRDAWQDQRFDLLRDRADQLPESARARVLESIDDRQERAEGRRDDRDERRAERDERGEDDDADDDADELDSDDDADDGSDDGSDDDTDDGSDDDDADDGDSDDDVEPADSTRQGGNGNGNGNGRGNGRG